MTTLAKGGNTAIDAATVRAELTWGNRPGAPEVAGAVRRSTAAGRVRDDSDMVFFNAPEHGSGAVRLVPGSASGTAAVEVDVTRLPADIDKVVIVGSADGGTFAQVAGLSLAVLATATGTELARFSDIGATTETALVIGELYRRAGSWKFRAVGQGWATGLQGLATDFGITVDEPTTGSPPPSAAPPAATGAAVPRPAVNLDKGRVSLRKGERVTLVKTGAPALDHVVMGLGWDPASGKQDIDLDASCIAYDAGGRKLEIVWFMHLKEFKGAIVHTGDNLTGEGEGDDEQIRVRLGDLPSKVHALVFVINSFRGHKFTDVTRAFCRLIDGRDESELVRFDLTASEPRTAVLMAALVRTSTGAWEMHAVGSFHDGRTVKALVDPAAAVVREVG